MGFRFSTWKRNKKAARGRYWQILDKGNQVTSPIFATMIRGISVNTCTQKTAEQQFLMHRIDSREFSEYSRSTFLQTPHLDPIDQSYRIVYK